MPGSVAFDNGLYANIDTSIPFMFLCEMLTCIEECSPRAECPPPRVDNQVVASINNDHLYDNSASLLPLHSKS